MNPDQAPSGEPPSESSQPNTPHMDNGHGSKLQPSAEFAAEQHGSAPGISPLSEAASATPAAPAVPVVSASVTQPPSAAPAANTNLQNVYPQPGETQHFGVGSSSSSVESTSSTLLFDIASLVLGIVATVAYVIMSFKVKSIEIAEIIGVVIALIALALSVISYRKAQKVNFIMLIAVAVAVFALMSISTVAISQVMIHNVYSSSNF